MDNVMLTKAFTVLAMGFTLIAMGIALLVMTPLGMMGPFVAAVFLTICCPICSHFHAPYGVIFKYNNNALDQAARKASVPRAIFASQSRPLRWPHHHHHYNLSPMLNPCFHFPHYSQHYQHLHHLSQSCTMSALPT